MGEKERQGNSFNINSILPCKLLLNRLWFHANYNPFISCQDVGSSLSPSQTLTTMVGVGDASEGDGGGGGGVPNQGEVTGEEKDDVACYNHEFFHGGMAKTAPSKNEPMKLKVGRVLIVFSFFKYVLYIIWELSVLPYFLPPNFI